MTRYADPERCPDCLARMPYGASRCPGCGLSLEGPLAAQLFTTLSRADQLLTAMREASAVPAGARPSAAGGAAEHTAEGATEVPPPGPGQPPLGAQPGAAGAPQAPPHREHVRVSGASVPRILLGLGALCLLVAALVFLAVAWSAMGVAGRTGTLLGFTLVAGGLSWWAARRDLRAASESLGVVAFGLLAFDMLGARSAGWLGDVDLTAFLVELGAVLTLVGAAAALSVRRTPVSVLRSAEVVATLGTALVVGGTAASDRVTLPTALTLLVVLTSGIALAARAARLQLMSIGTAAVGVLTWCVLTSTSWNRALEHPTLRELWVDREIWPLLVSAAFAAALALVRRLPLGLRVAALAVSLVVLGAALLAPFMDETTTQVMAAAAALVLVVSVAGWLVPQPWRRSFGAVAGLGLLWTSVSAVLLAAEGLERVVQAGTPWWSGGPGGSFPVRVVGTYEPASWLLPVLVVATVAALVALARSFTWADRVVAPLLDIYAIAAAAAATAALTLTLYPVPVWLVTAVLLLTATGYLAAAVHRRQALPLALAAAFFAVALVLGLHDAWLTLLTLAVLLGAATVVHLRWPTLEVSVGAGSLVPGALAGLVWTVGMLTDAAAVWDAVAVVLVLAALVLGGPYVDQRIRQSGPATYARLGTEVGALAAAAVVSVAAVEIAPWSSRPTWAAVYLTLAGAAASAMALLRPDRRLVGWLGGILLVAASWVRLADLGVRAPEAYTLPSAVALLVVGLVHLRRHPRAGTMTALSPGILLGLVPSLLWVLADPTAVRAVPLGAACLALVLGGARLHWAAPVVQGAVVGAVLVVRYAVPVAQGIPQWVLIGAAGVLLVAVGITWEQRVRDARKVAGYVRGLR